MSPPPSGRGTPSPTSPATTAGAPSPASPAPPRPPGLLRAIPALINDPVFGTSIIVLASLVGLLGIVTLDRTGDPSFQVLAILLYLALFAWLYMRPEASRNLRVAFLVSWAVYAVAGFTARTDFLMGSDIHREFRALSFLGEHARWAPLAFQEISYSSVWLMVGTRMIADLASVSTFTILKYVYPVLLALVVIPLTLTFERAVGTRHAFAAVFVAVSLLSFWESTAQIAKASISILLTGFLLYATLALPRGETRTYVFVSLVVVALVLTHYTSSILILLILAMAWTLETAYERYWRSRGLSLAHRRTVKLGAPVAFGLAVYAVWYRAMPYVAAVLETSFKAPFERILAILSGRYVQDERGETVRGTLGAGSGIGYWSIRISLLLLALAIVAGWWVVLRRIMARRAPAPEFRLFTVQTAALGVTAAGFIAPTQLDSNRLFAICLVVAASLMVAWVFTHDSERRTRRILGRHPGKLVLAGALVIASSQIGLVFLAAEGTAFSTNLGNEGPVYDRYVYNAEGVALRTWTIAMRGTYDLHVTSDHEDLIHENPTIPLDSVYELPKQSRFAVGGVPIDAASREAIVCYDQPGIGTPLRGSQAVFTTGRTLAFLDCYAPPAIEGLSRAPAMRTS